MTSLVSLPKKLCKQASASIGLTRIRLVNYYYGITFNICMINGGWPMNQPQCQTSLGKLITVTEVESKYYCEVIWFENDRRPTPYLQGAPLCKGVLTNQPGLINDKSFLLNYLSLKVNGHKEKFLIKSYILLVKLFLLLIIVSILFIFTNHKKII